ncbi:GNAT family N-acetyltransferase [Lentisphaera profundi]|uniref:GNAT family N-acetyltransferase n=1 Tax=Lentisphaera profundi TaxID=1658616 RepID=A0ABY7VZ05_9BACT|nr:GNAT family N-acetyltransferase [Lentisphaera profundi]WDE99151.1 GNAT family N-acetyltransferase [Lentisphaera profundi]
MDLKDFLHLNKMIFTRQSKNLPYTESYVKKLHKACQDHQSSKIFIAVDPEGRHHAGVYLIWDKESAYYIMGGGDPELRNSGATSLCMWEAIKFASTVSTSFNFEGSMIEPIESFFRAFGAIQKPYFNITKTNSKLLKIAQLTKSLLR